MMKELTPIKASWLILAFVSTIAILSACGSDKGSGGTTSAFPEDTPPALAYVGTHICLSCHEDKETFLETGHNFKLNKVVDGEMPQYPFSDITGALGLLEGVVNEDGAPTSYDDVSYVIGGFFENVAWLDKEGYIVSGEKVFARMSEDGTVEGPGAYMWSFGPFLGPEAQPYNCGRCHTTGWKQYTSEEGDNRNLNRQDDLEGIDGTFNQGGIQCESCHGAGSEHVKSPSSTNITRRASRRKNSDFLADDMAYGKAVACYECHTEGGDRLYPTYVSHYNGEFGGDSVGGRVATGTGGRGGRGGRISGDTILGIDPDTGVAMGGMKAFHCSTCHNMHQSTHYRNEPGHEDGLVRECTDCHNKQFAEVEGGGMAAAAHEFVAECIDCHMPSYSHMFKIDISAESTDASHYSEDGAYRKPWLRASDSCQGCHEDDFEDRAASLKNVHL